MHRRAVHRRKPRGDLHRADCVLRLQRPHRHDQWAAEHAGRHAGNVGAIHRHVGAAGDVADLDAVIDQRLLKGERTADREADQVVTPDVAHIGRLRHQFPVPPDAIARDVGADVEVRAERGKAGSPASETARTGHGFGLAWAKRRKSCARAFGRITRFACTLPGAKTCGRAGEMCRSGCAAAAAHPDGTQVGYGVHPGSPSDFPAR